eukprot:824871-Ditylum_brightwellii.AAC.1
MGRRTNAMFCGPQHSQRVLNILRNDFKFQEVASNAMDWDIIYGGYPHCGSSPFDWEMKTGLNKRLNEQGWSNLQPHQ